MEAAPYLSARVIVRIVLIIVAVVLTLYLIYLLRKPLTWLFIALFLAVALSGPVKYLEPLHEARVRDRDRLLRRCSRIIIALVGAADAADRQPGRRRGRQPAPLRAGRPGLRPQEQAAAQAARTTTTSPRSWRRGRTSSPSRIGDAAGTLRRHRPRRWSTALFALVTILVLTVFMLGSGTRLRECLFETAARPSGRRECASVRPDDMSARSAGYVAGVLVHRVRSTGCVTYHRARDPRRAVRGAAGRDVGLLDLIPLVGATIGAVLVGHRDRVRRLPDRHDRLGDLGDRLPAGGEQRHAAADPVARRCSVHH